MSVVVVTAVPLSEHPDTVIAAFEKAIVRVHQEPGVERYPLHDAPDRLVMIEKYKSEQARSEHASAPPWPIYWPPWTADSGADSTSKCLRHIRPETPRRGAL
jgi:Antibiotic biosynthesis monooxygenase